MLDFYGNKFEDPTSWCIDPVEGRFVKLDTPAAPPPALGAGLAGVENNSSTLPTLPAPTPTAAATPTTINPVNATTTTSPPVMVSQQRDPLNIRDPMNPALNVGRNCFRFYQVQSVLKEAYSTLKATVAGFSPSQERLASLAESINAVDKVHTDAQERVRRGGVAGEKITSDDEDIPASVAQLLGRFSTMPAGPYAVDGGCEDFPLLRSIISSLRV